MKGAPLCLLFLATCCPPQAAGPVTLVPTASQAERDLALPEEVHLKNVRQLTFGGDNAEAYWAFGGDRLILQTNKSPYKCDQIEVLTLADRTSKLVSTGKGRTTCAYFLKGDQEIVYASTHEHAPGCPQPPDMSKGYMWGLFEFDIYKAKADGSELRNLTPNTPGYDAEATVCPTDGSIIFTSTRSGDLELWRMDADGQNLKQLTNQPGYDGGAFFSSDCTKIVWRSSRPQGKDLEQYRALLAQNLVKPTQMDLYVANADGSDARQLTYMPGAEFAPFFAPGNQRILFSSNFKNPRSPEFDLFAINIDGSGLEQITFSPGFDGFPVFSPDGTQLAFSSNRRDVVGDTYRVTGTPAGPNDTNVFLADWVDAAPTPVAPAPETAAADRFAALAGYLAADEREGRGVGTRGLDEALTRVEQELAAVGVEPGWQGGWRQPFEVTTEVKRGAATALALDGAPVAAAEYTPLAASATGSVSGAIVPVGYGLVEADAKLDDYKGKNVRGKIALAYRFLPAAPALEPARAARLGDLRHKAFIAKQKGAKALLVVDAGDLTQDEAPLPALAAAESEAGIPIIVLSRKAAAGLLRTGRHTARLTVALEPVRTPTANLVGVIRAGAPTRLPGVVVVGAHIDHLGMGGPDALDPSVHAIHNGADDNASGVAALVEVARTLAAARATLARDVHIVAFSAEEMGVLGAHHHVKHPPTPAPIVAMLNMDMVGRMRMSQLYVSGGESAKEWKELVAPACEAAGVECMIGGSGYGPSDHMPFYIAGVPVLFLFTGNHLDYHKATDDAARLNASGGARVALIASQVALATANRAAPLTYVKAPPEMFRGGDVRRRGASLGTVPSYGNDPNAPKGVLLSDVAPGGAAAQAGLAGGDLITQIGTTEIASVSDLMYVLETAKPGARTTITFVRGGKTQRVDATFGAPRGRR